MRAPVRVFCALSIGSFSLGCPSPDRPSPNVPPTQSSAASRTSAPSSLASVSAPPVRVEHDDTRTMGRGTVVPAPAQWFVSQLAARIVLDDPDHQVRIVVVEMEGEKAADAIAQAWSAIEPQFSHRIESMVTPRPGQGLDEIVAVRYSGRAGEDRRVEARAQRKGNHIVVVLIQGSGSALNRRGAQIDRIVTGVTLPGTEEENFASARPALFQGNSVREFEAFVAEVLVRTHVPGAAIAVVQNGRIAYEKGFGVRELGRPDQVTPNTLMMLGSVTKPMTTLMMATLVDEGKVSWDTPATSVSPSFALGDADVTRKLTMKHFFCNCTGMPRNDLEVAFEFKGLTPEKVVAGLKTVAPTTGLGETYQYSNQMVATGGFFAAHVASPSRSWGDGYDAAMQARVFGPLGLTSTTLSFDKAIRSRDRAMPHALNLRSDTSKLPPEIERVVMAIRPSGGVWSSAHDMARYLATELARGVTPEGSRVVSEANLVKRWDPQVQSGDKRWYGLGWVVADSRGVRTIWHDGSTFGFHAVLAFYPDKGVGIVVLTNTKDADAFIRAVRWRLFELLFGAKPVAADQLGHVIKTEKEELDKILQLVDSPDDPSWILPWLGGWKHPALGTVQISTQGNPRRYVLDAGEWRSSFQRVRQEAGAKLMLTDPPLAGLELSLQGDGGSRTIMLDFGQFKYVFQPSRTPTH